MDNIVTSEMKPVDPDKVDAFRNELLGRLYYWKMDCDLIADVIRRDGPQYNNIELFRTHVKKYEEVIAK